MATHKMAIMGVILRIAYIDICRWGLLPVDGFNEQAAKVAENLLLLIVI